MQHKLFLRETESKRESDKVGASKERGQKRV